jgi:hypothetical protein
VSCYVVVTSCNRLLLWGWIPQEVRIALKSCIIYISCSDSVTPIHRPPQTHGVVARCSSNAHGPAGTWNADRYISDVLAFQKQRSWRGCYGLAWPGLGAEHFRSRHCVFYTKWRQFNWNCFSATWRSAASRFVSGRKCIWHLVTDRSVFCRPTVVAFFGIVIPLCLSLDVFIARANTTTLGGLFIRHLLHFSAVLANVRCRKANRDEGS